MPEKPKTRPLSASRKRRQRNRRSSLDVDLRTSETIFNPSSGTDVFYSGIDFRTIKEKIENLENEMELHKDDSTFEEHLNSLVLLQLYKSLEYGEISIENARAYLNLSKFYFNHKNLLPQAKSHILKARQILEELNKKSIDNHLIQTLLAFEIYILLIKCSFQAKKYLFQRDIKIKNKFILLINTKYIDNDLYLIEEYLEKLKHLMNSNEYDQIYMEYLLIKFDIIINNLKEFNYNLDELIQKILEHIDKYPSNNQIKQKINIYLHYGFYLINFDNHISEGLNYYKKSVELAEEDEKQESSDINKYQLANAFFQWGKAKIRVNRLTDNTKRKFQRAIELYKQINNENDINILKVLDELANFYIKIEEFQDALNILCDSLSDKKRLFGDFSEEVIETESRIGAIYLRECKYHNAAEYLKECLDLQEFVYGLKDSRTCQTRNALEILKKTTQDELKQNRPAFRLSNKISYENDHQLLLTSTKKPPINTKN